MTAHRIVNLRQTPEHDMMHMSLVCGEETAPNLQEPSEMNGRSIS